MENKDCLCLYRSIDCNDPDPGGQATFTAVKVLLFSFTKGLSALDVQKFIRNKNWRSSFYFKGNPKSQGILN